MRKYLVLLFGVLMLVAMTASAYADIKLSGNARFRGMWKDTYNLNDDVDLKDRWMEQRVRLIFDGVNADGNWGVKARLTLFEKCFGGDNAASIAEGCTVKSNSIIESGDDYAYIWGKMAGYKLFVGKQHANWGHKFQIWENSKDRIKLVKKFGNTVVGAYVDKLVETRSADTSLPADGESDLDDKDNYAVFVKQLFGGGNAVGLKIDVQRDQRDGLDKTGPGPDGISGTADDTKDGIPDTQNINEDGWKADLFVDWNVANIKIEGDIAIERGDLWEKGHGLKFDGSDGSPIGGFLSAATELNSIRIKGLVGFTQDGFSADDDFTPTVMIGSDTPIALVGDFGKFAGHRVDTLLFVGEVATKVNPDLTVGGRLAYMDFEGYEDEFVGSDIGGTLKDGNAFEIDAGLDYNLASTTTYKIDAAYFIPNDLSPKDDNAFGLMHKLEVKF